MSIPPLPLPPADLPRRTLPTRVLGKGLVGYRCHDPANGALWFGPRDAAPLYRFDDPDGAYKVCYIAGSRLTAFVETFLRQLPTRSVTETSLQARSITMIEFTRDMTVVPLHGSALVRLGTTAAVSGAKLGDATNPYGHSQAWSRAIHEHPDHVDGIEYRSSHDDNLHSMALFDRARDAVMEANQTRPIWDDSALMKRVLKRYRIEIL